MVASVDCPSFSGTKDSHWFLCRNPKLCSYIPLLEKVHQIAYSKLLLGFPPSSFSGNLWCNGVPLPLFASNLNIIDLFIYFLDLFSKIVQLCLYSLPIRHKLPALLDLGFRAGGQYLFRNFVLRPSQVVIEPVGLFLSQRLAAPSINQGPFELGTTRDTLGTTPDGGVLLGPEKPRTYEDLSDTEKKRYDADVCATNIVLQGLPKDIYKLINHNIEAKEIWDNVKMLLAGSELTKEDIESQLYDEFERFKMLPGENINEYYVRFHKLVNNIRNIIMTMPNIQLNSKFVNKMSPEWDRQWGAHNRVGNANAGQGKPVKCYNCNGVGHIAILDEEELLFLAGEQGNTFDADVENQPVQDLALNEDNIFQAYECDAFDSDVDDEPTAQTILMANLSSVGVTNQDKHEIHNEVQQSNVIDSTSVDMGNSNVIPYEQYLLVNNMSVVPSCASSALNDVCVSSDNYAFVPHNPIATELKTYKEQVAIYEQRAKFELTERK
ncbi:hypothetical protein Tco_0968514 [Tanacetum coccineum]